MYNPDTLPILSSTSKRDKITSKLANATTQSAGMLCRNSRWVKSFAKEFQLRDEDFGDRKKTCTKSFTWHTARTAGSARATGHKGSGWKLATHTHTKKEVVHKTFSTLFWIVCECGCARWHRTWQPKSTQQQQHGADGTGWAGCFWRIYKHDLLRRTKLFFTRFFTAFPVQCLRNASLHHPTPDPTALHRRSARKKLHMLILLVISLPRGLVLTSLLKSLAWTELFATLLWCWSGTASILMRSLQIWMCAGNCRVQLKEVHYEPVPCCSRSVCCCSPHWLNNCTVSFGTFYLYSATVLRNSAFVPSDGVRWHECFLLLGY